VIDISIYEMVDAQNGVIIVEKRSLVVMSTLKGRKECKKELDAVGMAAEYISNCRGTSNVDLLFILNEKLHRKIGQLSSPIITFPEVKPKLSFSNMLKGIFPSH